MDADMTSPYRRLLRRLRDAITDGDRAQDRVDKVVRLIAADMVAEVCSCFIMRGGNELELFSAEGLQKDSVQRTRLRVGEGKIGEIAANARPLVVADVQIHPHAALPYEEAFHSLVGVPIFHSSRVVGVLAVLNRTMRHYFDEEVETLKTVAMVLADLVVRVGSIDQAEQMQLDGSLNFGGLTINRGVGFGVAVQHDSQIVIKRLVGEDPQYELNRVKAVHANLKAALEKWLSNPEMRDREVRDALTTYATFIDDKGWIDRIGDGTGKGLTAEAAVKKVHDDTRVQMSQSAGPYLHNRLQDLDDIVTCLLRDLSRDHEGSSRVNCPEAAILIAKNIGFMELLGYDAKRLRGIVLEEGFASANVAALARALNIPAVGQATGALEMIRPLDRVVCNGNSGHIIFRPPHAPSGQGGSRIDLSRWEGNEAAVAAIDAAIEQLIADLPNVSVQRIGLVLFVKSRDEGITARTELEIALRRIEVLEDELEAQQAIINELEERNLNLARRDGNGGEHDRSVVAAILYMDVAGYSELSEQQKEGVAQIVWGVAATLGIDRRAIFVSNTWGDAAVLALKNHEDALNAASAFAGAISCSGHHARVAVDWGAIRLRYNPARDKMDLIGNTVDRAARLEPMIKQLGDLVSIAVTETFHIRFYEKTPSHFKFRKSQVKLTKSFASHKAGDPFICYAVSDLRNISKA